jgi:hypothetical protein
LSDLLDAALRYAELGYPVFPCAPGDSRPITEHGFHNASVDPEQIERWWTEHPNANIGLPTAGLVVIDVDGASNPWPGAERGLELAIAPMATTPGGGSHRVFRQPAGRAWRCTQSTLAPHVDTRADGGYIVAPPSRRPDCEYRWVPGLELDAPPDRLPGPPGWLAAQLDGLATGSPTLAHVAADANGANKIPSGQRNATLARLGGTMRRVGMSQRLQAFGAGVRSLGTKFLGLGAAAITPLLATTNVFASMGDELAKMSLRTGISVESLSELGYAADQSGTNLETLEGSVRKMQKFLAEASQSSRTATSTLTRLGLTVSDLEGLSPDQQLERLADGLAQVRDPATKAALAMEVFGKSGTALLPLMQDGAAGIEALRQQARDLGLVISTEDAQSAEVSGDRLSDLWKVVKSSAFAIGATLAPVLQDLTVRTTRIAKGIADWVRQNRSLIVTVFKVAAGIVIAGTVLIGLGMLISGIGAAFGTAATLGQVWFVTFRNALGGTDLVDLTGDGSGLSGGTYFTVTKVMDGGAAGGLSEIQSVHTNGVGGTFTLSKPLGGTSAPLPATATPSQIKAAVEGLSGGTMSVTGSGTAADPWKIEFGGALAGTNQLQLEGNGTLLTGALSASVDVMQTGTPPLPNIWDMTIHCTTDGTFVLEFRGRQTAAIDYGAAAAAVQAALEALHPGDFAGLWTVVDSGIGDATYRITADGRLAGQPQLLVAHNEDLIGMGQGITHMTIQERIQPRSTVAAPDRRAGPQGGTASHRSAGAVPSGGETVRVGSALQTSADAGGGQVRGRPDVAAGTEGWAGTARMAADRTRGNSVRRWDRFGVPWRDGRRAADHLFVVSCVVLRLAYVDGLRCLPQRGARGTCPGCGGAVIAKCDKSTLTIGLTSLLETATPGRSM